MRHMTTDLLFKNFHLLADTPGGVKKLRQLILQLAVQGRLVPQNPDDEPASVLLEKIREEKKQLIREGKIKNQKPLPEIKPDEVPYELPDGWEWSCFEEVGVINPRNILNDDTEVSFIPMSLISEKYGALTEHEKRIWSELKKGYTHLAENDIVLAKITPCFQNQKSAVLKELINSHGAGTTELHVLRLINTSVVPEYALIFLKSPRYIAEGIPRMTGSAGQKRIPREYFSRCPFPLPPLLEQHRIVAKVDQLMALCDELEAKQEKQKTTHAKLNKSTLHVLTESRTNDELTSNWTRIKDNFNLLFTTPESIQELRSSILQLAVQGRLVPQNPDDEPALVLLEKIRDEKKRLIKEGKIKKQKPLPEIKLDEVPFELPKGWEWVRLGDMLLKLTDGTHHSPPNTEQGEYKYITAKNIKNFGIDLNGITYVSREVHRSIFSRCNPEFGDILYIKDGATTGVATINNLRESFSMLSSVALLKVPSHMINKYLLIVLRSPFFFGSMREDMSGVAITRVTLSKMSVAHVPIPPLPEQHRIAAKVDQLLALCDELESNLAQSQTDGEKLMQSVVAGLSSASSDQPEIVQ
jgi:type I restriction enzyme, S subunit